MKKVIAIILIVLSVFSLFSCAKNQGTKLTVDNYATYFEFHTSGSTTGTLNSTSSHAYYGYEGLSVNCSVNPISDKFIYNDVVFTVKLSGYYKYFDRDASYEAKKEKYIDDPQQFETTVTINVDIAGKGSTFQEYMMPDGKLLPAFSNYETLPSEYFECNYEVISVSGTIEKA